ncbi:TPA: hypothetical protein N0H37_005606 [Pseudomonas aeruginosa]|nr:hypothetical protein [Pseudomonas aeruginosa]HCK4565161.1 hypothetical protein [Pseudomonas aeruginosa]HCK4773847.1 hypothetical protein [Pseudomonas aeruginosa]
MRSLTLIPLLTSCIISPLCASQPFPNTQVTDGQLLARDFNRGGHSHVQKRANKLHNHAGKRQIRVHNYANEAVPFIVHGKKAFRGKHVKKDIVGNGRRFKGSPTNSFSPGQAQQRPKSSLERLSALLLARQIGRWWYSGSRCTSVMAMVSRKRC